MNKKLIVGMLAAFMAMAPWCGHAAQTIDSPHSGLGNQNSDLGTAGANGAVESCIYCHNQAELNADNECKDCHTSDTGPYGTNAAGASIAPFAKTHQDLADNKFKCTACHNPHVSLQETTLTGDFTVGSVSYDAVTGKSTLTGLSAVPDTNWVTKSGVDPFRGMILWVVVDGTTTPPDMASYEVQSIVAGATAAESSVTVQGEVPLSVGSFDLRRGQLIAKNVTKDLTKNYRAGDLAVQFPSQGNTSIYIDKLHGSTPTGVCQVCHTQTAYWRSDGTLTDHNADQVCTTCHLHSSGFKVTGCTACHSGPDPDGPPIVADDMAKPPTGSQTVGMHAVHATPDGADGTIGYNYSCDTCHYGTGMDRINDLADYRDGIQIGFKTDKYPQGYFTSYNGQVGVSYQGTNHTTVTNTGGVGADNLKCSNVYCHSNGKSIRLGCATSLENTSPAWDGLTDPQGDTVKCNNCHGYARNIATPIASGAHTTHVSGQGIPCAWCHANTVDTSGLIIDRTKHANSVYDIKASGKLGATNITFTYDSTARTCNSMSACHGSGRVWVSATVHPDTETCIPVERVCDPVTNPDALVNLDPVVSLQAVNLDPNTVKYIDASTDPDRIDPVKNLCQGGGFDGTPGYVKFIAGFDTAVLGNITEFAPLDGAPGPTVVRSFRDANNILDITTDPDQPRAWMNYLVIDNGPNSLAKSKLPPVNTGGAADNDGSNWSGWFATIMNPLVMTETNAHPILDFAVSAVRTGANTCTLTITDNTVDEDAIDPDKQQHFGGGHNGSDGKARLYFLDSATGVDTGLMTMPYRATPQNIVKTTTVYGASGTGVWYSYLVRDNHYISAPGGKTDTYTVYSGWRRIVLP